MRMKKDTYEAAHIGSILTGLIGGLRPEAEQGMLGIWKVWDRAAGDEVARNARPAAFKGSILLVHVTSPAWIHHLQFSKPELIVRLNTALGQPLVSEIKFKVGSF
jgi:predicted nucleic acid-binding Zn ribbon protein